MDSDGDFVIFGDPDKLHDEMQEVAKEQTEAMKEMIDQHDKSVEGKPGPPIDSNKLKYMRSGFLMEGPHLDKWEPYFVIRGNDALALPALRHYMDKYTAIVVSTFLDDSPPELLKKDANYESLKEILRFFEWYQDQFSARVKNPD